MTKPIIVVKILHKLLYVCMYVIELNFISLMLELKQMLDLFAYSLGCTCIRILREYSDGQ